MHMADALISPGVGAAGWVAAVGLIGYCSRRLREAADDRLVPLMGVLGSFIFAAQMINFNIPGTGSSGHLGGGMILAILLGPYAAFLVMASVLTVQALFFADGGLLALGCNMVNLGFFTCFVAYPLVYRRIAGDAPGQGRIMAGAVAASVVGLQLGALAVVVETVVSGRTALPFGSFLLLMQPIHLAIGFAEGVITAAVVIFVWKAQPGILYAGSAAAGRGTIGMRNVLIGLCAAALVTGGVLSWFASSHPDGLEWAVFKTTGTEEPGSPQAGIHGRLAALQERTALLPDYALKSAEGKQEQDESWPAVDAGTSVSGLVGGVFTLLAAFAIGWFIRKKAHIRDA